MSKPTLIHGKFGTWEVVGYDGGRRREIYRPHEVHPKEPWNKEIHESAMCLNHEDVTPHHAVYPSGYNAECSCCWLNIPHTEALHQAKVAKG